MRLLSFRAPRQGIRFVSPSRSPVSPLARPTTQTGFRSNEIVGPLPVPLLLSSCLCCTDSHDLISQVGQGLILTRGRDSYTQFNNQKIGTCGSTSYNSLQVRKEPGSPSFFPRGEGMGAAHLPAPGDFWHHQARPHPKN